MSKWKDKNQRKNLPYKRPTINDGYERVFVGDIANKKEVERREQEKSKPTKKSKYQEFKDIGAFHFFAAVALFAIVALSFSFYQISIDERTPVTIKLSTVDNYTNLVTDECGYIYSPTNPRLSTSISVTEKEKDLSAPAIMLNESDVYEAIVMSSPALRQGMYHTEITGFKLTDPSKYIKNC